MRKSALIILILLLATGLVSAQSHRPLKYRIGLNYGLGNYLASENPRFTLNHKWGLTAGTDLGDFTLSFSLITSRNYSDSTAVGNFAFFAPKDDAQMVFKSIQAGFDLDYKLQEWGRFRPIIGVGLGYLIWEIADPPADTLFDAIDEHGNSIDYRAAEMYLKSAIGGDLKLNRRFMLSLRLSYGYMTGIGTTFSDSINNSRGRSFVRAGLTFSYLFGETKSIRRPGQIWLSSDTWKDEESTRRPAAERDSDGDNIPDAYDDCPNTPTGAFTDDSGCPHDKDGDGVLDGLDDCPKTPRSAAGYVDIFGCPIDSDYDGVADYRDSCRSGPIGAGVDDYGCPLDGDNDGVFDGLDDCPDTEPDIDVDLRGCINTAFLNDVMRIYIDYPSGSFEVDVRTKTRLQPLIKKLKILNHIEIQIQGYTDNIGPSEPNLILSQKRANRMRDWLVSEGIATERLTPVGKGETNFISSNQTAKGRAKNRRIELVFSE